jgi:dihydroorotate dehydrogenase
MVRRNNIRWPSILKEEEDEAAKLYSKLGEETGGLTGSACSPISPRRIMPIYFRLGMDERITGDGSREQHLLRST